MIIFELYFKYSLPAKNPALIIPKYTNEPSNPSSASPTFKSFFIYSVAAGIIPWSILMKIFVKHMQKKISLEPLFAFSFLFI